MTTVTLLIFSGRPDPKWELPEEDARELVKLLESHRSASPGANLGYRGFFLESNDPGLPPQMIIRDQPEAERFLLRTGDRFLPPEVAAIAADAIK